MRHRPTVALACDIVFPYSRGGREIRNEQLLPWVAKHANIHVYTMHWWNGPSTYRKDGVVYHAITAMIPLYKKGCRSPRQAVMFGLDILRLLVARFDVLEADHIPYIQVFVLRLVATVKRKPFIVTWHEVWSRGYWLEYLGRKGMIAWFLESLAVHMPDHIVAASPQTADRLRQLVGYTKPITVVPNGIDINLIQRTPPTRSASNLIAIGRPIEHKRIYMLLDVIALLKKTGIDATCTIIGDGPARPRLEHQARSLQISDKVEFNGRIVDQSELYSLLEGSKLFLSLSEREGFGIVVLEAIGSEVAVLTTSSPDNLSQELVASLRRSRFCGRGFTRLFRKWRSVLPTLFPGPLVVPGLLAFSVHLLALIPFMPAMPCIPYPRGFRLGVVNRSANCLFGPHIQLHKRHSKTQGSATAYGNSGTSTTRRK